MTLAPKELSQKILNEEIARVETLHPEYPGAAKKGLVIDAFEKRIIDVYNGIDKYAYDFPPFVDFAVNMGVPYISEVTEIVRELLPTISAMIEAGVKLVKGEQ